jgi:hypothetical protein
MKKYHLYLITMIAISMASIAGAQPVSAQTYYQCEISGTGEEGCNYGTHYCQIYNHSYTPSVGVPRFCYGHCLERSNIPPSCANVSVSESINPEAHQRAWVWFLGFVQDIDPVESDQKTTEGSQPETTTETSEETAAEPIVETEEDESYNPFEADVVGFNEYKMITWPDKNGERIAKVAGPYGTIRYTKDGKHYYDKPYDAAHSDEGMHRVANVVSDMWGGVKSIFSLQIFRGKLKDTDKELQRTIAREVLSESKSQKEKDVEKAYEELSGHVETPPLGDVPAKVIIEAMKEATATEFAQGAMIYITEREAKRSPKAIYDNPPEEMIYGGMHGVSQAINASQPKAVLFSRYEEVYQRYKLAKELGRTK